MNRRCLLALGVILAGITTNEPLTAQQKPAQQEQQKLKDRIDALDNEIKAVNEKSDRAAMEKDYIERIQTDAKAYYEKAFNTQLIIVSIIGLFLAVVGKFGVDHIVHSKVTEASANLRAALTTQLAAELEKLRQSNAAQVKLLQDNLQKRMNELEHDLNCRTSYSFYVAQGQAAGADGRHDQALNSFRRALKTYKSGQHLFATDNGGRVLRNIFVAVKNLHKDNFTEEAKKELANELYNDLEDELAQAALVLTWLGPLVVERVTAQPTPAETHPSGGAV